jgi:GrpB-like predicted nucleotidyltransferase (UPF0157 family)
MMSDINQYFNLSIISIITIIIVVNHIATIAIIAIIAIIIIAIIVIIITTIIVTIYFQHNTLFETGMKHHHSSCPHEDKKGSGELLRGAESSSLQQKMGCRNAAGHREMFQSYGF